MQLSDLELQVGKLCSDENHIRYQISDVDKELDNTIGQWNEEIRILKDTVTIPLVQSQRQYPLVSSLVGTPIAFPRVTCNGLDMKKRGKSYFDLYTSYDWTLIIGTPTDFFIEATDPANLFLTVYPTPTSNDAGKNLVAEYVVAHTPMVNATDVPWMSGSTSSYLCRPYDFYISYSAAARLLARDPSPENGSRAGQYLKIAAEGKDLLTNVFKGLEQEEPLRLRGGREW